MSFFSGFMGGRGPFGADDDDDEPGPVDKEAYYKRLGVGKKASQDQIKKAFLDLAKKHHPDKGGDKKTFSEIKEAYEVLNDPDKREIYDRYGKKGLRRGGGGGEEDLLNMFFGGGRGGPSRQRQMPKTSATKKKLDLTLEEAYSGCIKKIPLKRTRCCETCKGKGGSDPKTCTACKGKGVVLKVIQMGPMIQQMQQQCSTCRAQGTIIEEKNKCKACKGAKVVEKQKILEVSVEKGTSHEQVITLPGEGDEMPDALPGDVHFIVVIPKHPVFTRVGADLFIPKKITLLEALTGFEFTLKHLDGTVHQISLLKNEVISDQENKIVRGLGMPFYKDPMNFGNLIVQFQVVMPPQGSIGKDKLEALEKVLGGKMHPRPTDDKYDMLEEFDPHTTNTSEEGGHKQEEEQDESSGPQRVQCASH